MSNAKPLKSFLGKLKQPKVYIPLGVLVILYIALNIWVYFCGTKAWEGRLDRFLSFISVTRQKSPPAPTASPTPTPTPSYLAPGKIVYTISQSSEIPGPRITSLTLDDHNPKPKSVQKLEVTTSYDKPVDSVLVKITSDHKERTVKLVKKQESDAVWQGSWQLDDSILYKDIYTITAVSGHEESSVVTAPRS